MQTASFLDKNQYDVNEIQKYEAIYGADFVSPGGASVSGDIIEQLALKSGQRVLDVGCGLGGAAFLMSRDYGVQVTGIDLSANMAAGARQRTARYGLADSVDIIQGDCLKFHDTSGFNAIHSRDVFLHIHDKAKLFRKLLSLLKPGGRLLFTDYCAGPKPWTEAFAAYVLQRGYDLHEVVAYAQLVADAGFEAVESTDLTQRFIRIQTDELERLPSLDFPTEVIASLEKSWKDKLARTKRGEHRWGLFTGRRSIDT